MLQKNQVETSHRIPGQVKTLKGKTHWGKGFPQVFKAPLGKKFVSRRKYREKPGKGQARKRERLWRF